ncbi:MAG: hypothetical protein L0271_11260 [Gemmatimonadetes bacterium]|nr:hypothetical protein [Gemmatimonadota bacterium]
MRRLAVALTIAIITSALALSLTRLDRFPPVHQDEPWIASPAAQLATTGTYGTPLFAGFHGAERNAFMFPPALPLLESAVFRVAGASVVTMRLPGVLAAIAILVLVAVLGTRAGGPVCAALATALLVLLAPAGGWNGTSGVPLLDIARVARYDILVPAFGLGALLCFHGGGASVSRIRLFIAGVLAGLATLAHLYGAFWLVGLTLVVLLRPAPRRNRAQAVLFLAAGFAIALAPALLWIASAWSDFVGQQQILTERYRVFDPRFLIDNLVREPQRYRPLLTRAEPFGWSLLRPGFWIAIGGATLVMARLQRSVRNRVKMHEHDVRIEFTALVVMLTQLVLFALVVRVKTYSYLISVWPLVALLIAVLAGRAFAPAAPGGRKGTMVPAALAVLLIAGFVEGGLRIRGWLDRAAAASPYAAVSARIAAEIPTGARILGLHQWWLGLRDRPFTSWLLPVWQSDPRFTERPIPLDQAIERVAPDVVLIDPAMAAWFSEIADPGHDQHARYIAWLSWTRRHGFAPIDTVADPTYGAIEVWRNTLQQFR